MKLRFVAGVTRVTGVTAVAGFLAGTVAVAGCGGGTSQTAATAQSQTSLQQQARAVWLDYARCVRSHGFPDFPDPAVDSQGKPQFPASPRIKSIGQQEQGNCGSILNRLPAAAQGRTPITPAELHQEVLLAACIRRHGLPDWPDPQPDGTFRLAGTPYATMGKSGPVVAALQACRQYDSSGRAGTSGS